MELSVIEAFTSRNPTIEFMQLRDQTHRCVRNLTNCDEENCRLFGLQSMVCDYCRLKRLNDPLEVFEFFLALLASLFSTLLVDF